MTWQDIGLVLYVLMSVIAIPVLIWDWWLGVSGHTMITTFCRAQPWCDFLILIGIMIGVMGLAVHLMAPVKIR